MTQIRTLASLDRGSGKRRGFSLVELLIVFAILGAVLAIAIPAYERYVEKARLVDAVNTMHSIQEKITAYQKTNGTLPASLAPVGYDSVRDPWGRAYVYVIITSPAVARRDKKLAPLNSDYDLYTVGRDGLTQNSLGHANSRDDVVRARDGRFVGLAEEFDP